MVKYAVDVAILIVYLGFMLWVGLHLAREQRTLTDYLLAGKKTPTLVLMTSWLASWIGGAAVVGAANKAYNVGISAMWYTLSMAIGFLVFGFTFSGLVKRIGERLGQMTYPDMIEDRYDARCRVVATVTTFLAYIAYTAGQLAAAGTLLSAILGWDPALAFWVSALVIIVYSAFGGLKAVLHTDYFQFWAILLSLAIAVPIMLGRVGGWSGIVGRLPPSYFNLGTWGWSTMLGITVTMVLTFYTAMDDYQRLYAARDERAARLSTVWAALPAVLIALGASTLGMAAKAAFPELPQGVSPAAAIIKEVLPAGLSGLVLVGFLSAAISTADTCMVAASANFIKDIYVRFINPRAPEAARVRYGMVVTLVVGLLAAVMAQQMMDIINILYIAFTINSANLFIPTIAAYFWKRATSSAAFWSMLGSLAVVLGWYVAGMAKVAPIFSVVDPVWPGLATSAVLFFGIALATKPSDQEVAKAMRFMTGDGLQQSV